MATGKLVPTAEAARRLHKSPRTIERWIVNGSLPGQRIGKVLAVDEAAVAARERADCMLDNAAAEVS